jgi:hypothetical protein
MPHSAFGRNPAALQKLARMNQALRHQEPDRVPISDFFWGGFVRRWRRELNLPDDADPYVHYDLDWIVTIPNMDPHVCPFEMLQENDEEVIVKTGFATTIRKRFDMPMPEQISWDTDTLEKLEAFEFDDPYDSRRFFWGGDNQIAGVGDSFTRDLPPWIDTVRKLRKDFVVYGSMIEAAECVTRMLGQLNTLQWIGEEPDRFGEQLLRIGDFYYHCLRAQIEAAVGMLDGIVIWGDVAYRKSLFFSPDYWREYFKPTVKRMIELCHRHELPVIYHGCGNTHAILPDFIELGLDAYNPLEAKAGLDAVELRRQYGHQLAFCGNSNVTVWEEGNRERIRHEVLRKLNAGKGGGLIFQSDHSVTSNVSGHTYDYIVNLVREYGRYPLQLGDFGEDI